MPARRLTPEEMLAAADAAARWPVNHSDWWGTEKPLRVRGALAAADALFADRSLVRCGCPSVAVANVRRRLSGEDLQKAFDDLTAEFRRRADLWFAILLHNEPSRVAEFLRTWAAEEVPA